MEETLTNVLGPESGKLAAQEKQVLLSRLLARLAHEIGNPLSSLDIHLQLRDEDLARIDPRIRQDMAGRLEIIRGELHRLENIVGQFLSLSGPTTVNLQSVAIRRVVEHVCALLRPEATGRGVEIALDLPEDLPLLDADPVQLTQALVNLVLNAIQAVGGRGRVVVRARADEAQHALCLEVADTGPGVAAEKQTAVFDPFFTTRAGGSGLGLWVVQQIVMAHGGSVEVANAPEGGAVFTLQLPLRANRPPAPAGPRAAGAGQTADG